MEEETLCYIIPSYWFSSIGWTYFDQCTYIQMKPAHVTSYTVMIFEWKWWVDWGYLHHWFKFDIKYQLIRGLIFLQNTLPIQNLWLTWKCQPSSGCINDVCTKTVLLYTRFLRYVATYIPSQICTYQAWGQVHEYLYLSTHLTVLVLHLNTSWFQLVYLYLYPSTKCEYFYVLKYN